MSDFDASLSQRAETQRIVIERARVLSGRPALAVEDVVEWVAATSLDVIPERPGETRYFLADLRIAFAIRN